jgi:hypothetical protein
MSNSRLFAVTFALVALISACSVDTSLAGPRTVAEELPGTWAQVFSVPGASTVMTLALADTTISGSGTFTIEAGASGTLAVTGMITAGSTIDLDLTRSDGWVAHFRGTLVTPDSLSGYAYGHWTTMIGIGDPAPAEFHRVVH